MDFIFDHLLILGVVAIGLITVLIELSIRQGWFGFFIGRKMLHIVAVSICAFVIQHYPFPIQLGYIFVCCGILLLFLIFFAKLLVQQDHSLGIALFPIAFGTMLLSGWMSSEIIGISALILAISDPVAGLAGSFSKAKTSVYISEKKSWLGTTAFILSTTIILYCTTTFSILSIIGVAIIISLSEMFSARGSDNFSIPWVAGFMLQMLDDGLDDSFLTEAVTPCLLIMFAYLAYWRRWLDVGGAISAWLIGTIAILSYGEIALFAPAFMLIAGSLIPRLFGKEGKSAPRNARQVWANGLVAIICMMIHYLSGDYWYYLFFLSAISLGICDTMSSEIGTIIRGKTIDIVTFKTISPGLSGGISWQGSLAGAIAVLLFVLCYHLLFTMEFGAMWTIIFIGVAGMLVDSWLGSQYQSLYVREGVETEMIGDANTKLIKGHSWVDNDVVNILSHFVTMGLVIICYEMSLAY